jgi:hypothetical protein
MVFISQHAPTIGPLQTYERDHFHFNSKSRQQQQRFVQEQANEYRAKKFGLPPPPISLITQPLDEEFLKNVADWYDNAISIPYERKVRAAYQHLIDETFDQFDFIAADELIVEPFTFDGEPYESSAAMIDDVLTHRHLWFLPTDSAFGEVASENDESLMLEQSPFLRADGIPLLANDVFRIIHDYFGHTQHGFTFGPVGEFRAFIEHATMFSPLACQVLATETLCQNAWVNFGPHLRRADGSIPKRNDADYIPPQDRPFAAQKMVLCPKEFLRVIFL